ncbi:MAG: AAA domain-containing protein [Muribaculaceae bacterium]|nr:AAA domain-containing protein [Muribaculaceae bacterium]
MEYEHERKEFQRLTETMGVGRKVKRGDCWFPVSVGRSYYNSLNQLVVEINRNDDSEIEHNFEYGRQVMFFAQSGLDDISYFKFTGTVSYAEADRMVIIMPDQESVSLLMGHDSVGVQLSFDETTYKLMIEALGRVINAKGNRLAQLRDTFYNRSETGKYTFAPMRFPWLNATQERAVNEVLWAKDVAIVHGPPGTGKTTTLVEAIYETLRRENQVLVCAQSNMAVDWISERLMDRGIDVLRVGNPTRVNDKMLSQTYERRYEDHPDYPQLWALRKTMRELRGNRHRSEAFHQKMDRLKNRAMELELRIHNDLFSQARVISCTLAGSASRVLEGMKFSTLFIDEAAQALEAACWIAIRKAGRVIFAGDHQQLPPTVKCLEALKGGLGKTLMERIVESNPQVVTLLKVQYRMNEEIMRFSSDWFYNGEVESAPEVKYRGILDYDNPMMWIDTSEVEGGEEFVGESYGRVNRSEAQLTIDTLKEFFEKVGRDRVLEESIDVGIISPYRAQVQLLRRMIRHNDYFKPLRRLVTVNTVDGFQGQERDIIVISMVRDNDEGQIGFLRDLRRMNVAITRARMKLIIMGNAETMSRHPFYKKLYEYINYLNL